MKKRVHKRGKEDYFSGLKHDWLAIQYQQGGTIMKRFIWSGAIVLATLLGVTFEPYAQEKGKENAQISKQEEQIKISYYCPMHPEVVSNKPGKCPKCGMNLEKKTSVKPEKEEQVVYYCPMHSEVTSNKPGKCPKCGMNMEMKKSTGSKEKADMGMNMEMDPMCAKMCDMMMNDPSKMKMMQDCMMMGMNDMKDMKDMKETKGSTRMEGMSMGKMKSCCGMMKNK